MGDDQEDFGDVDEGLADRIREAAEAARAAPTPSDDYQRHLAAERRWQARRHALALWERIKRGFWGYQ